MKAHLMSDWEIATMILRRPRMCFSQTKTLRDVLALLHGVAVGRYPPHGSGFLDGFGTFLQKRLKIGLIEPYPVLLTELGEKPLHEACEALLQMLEEWKQSTPEREV